MRPAGSFNLYRKGKTSAVGAMERKATPRGQLAELLRQPREAGAPWLRGAWPVPAQEAKCPAGGDRPGTETLGPLLKRKIKTAADQAASMLMPPPSSKCLYKHKATHQLGGDLLMNMAETATPLLKWMQNGANEAAVRTMVPAPSSENLYKHEAMGQLGGDLLMNLNHPNIVSLPPLPEGGEVEERAVVTDDNQDAPSFVNEPVDSLKSTGSSEKEAASEGTASALSPPPAVSPRNKRKRNDAEDSGTSKAEEVSPSRQKATYDPYLESLISSDDEEEVPTLDVAARTSTSHTLIVSETPVEGEESSPPQQNVGAPTPPSSPLVPSPKRTRVETIVEPTLQLGSSSNPLLDDPMIKELVRIGAQFIGYREYASKTEEKLAEANKLVDTLAQKLQQSETAHKKAELDASQAKAEADEAKAKAAAVEDLQKRLDDAETALNEHKAAQATREKAIVKRLNTQNRRFLGKTNQEFELEDPDNDPLLDALAFLEFHGTEVREGMEHADAGLSKLFPYFFPKKEEPKTFIALAKEFNPPEDLGLKMRQENMKIAVKSTIALVADSQQTVDWMKVGDTDQLEQTKWRSLIKAAKPNTKKILAYLGIKPSSTPSSSRPEV
ncbi:hypothetical protein QYE76_058526 [Lolium multiflorum]|uniref:Uncharacterized protein n=1 Tax=Lolium multiflorum TaxID=4521 RepID=A0AAD8T5T1_LOLMU|nr:hypothetical protein QYE76_058526 [Lolium multiflorum]